MRYLKENSRFFTKQIYYFGVIQKNNNRKDLIFAAIIL